MTVSRGYEISMEDKGHIRRFTVAETELSKAICALQQDLGLRPISQLVVPSEVISYLGLKPGQYIEWVMADQKLEMSARGTPIP